MSRKIEIWEPCSHWENHPEHSQRDWAREVMEGNTRQGYVDWVNSQIEEHSEQIAADSIVVDAMKHEISIEAAFDDWADSDFDSVFIDSVWLEIEARKLGSVLKLKKTPTNH